MKAVNLLITIIDLKEEADMMEEEEKSSDDEFDEPVKETYESDVSDDFPQQFSYAEDAVISADQVSFSVYRTIFKKKM